MAVPGRKRNWNRCAGAGAIHETSRLGALLEGGREILGGLVRQVERAVGQQAQSVKGNTRIGGAEGASGIGVDVRRRPFPAGPPLRRFGVGATRCGGRRDCAADKIRRQSLSEGLLVEKAEGAEASVGEKRPVGDAELEAKAGEERIFVGGGQWISQPLPSVALIERSLVALDDG